MAASPKKLSDYLPPLKEQGIDYVAAAGKPGQGVQGARVVQSGAAPLVVTFAALGMKDMADADYAVVSQVEGAAGAVTVDESTKTTAGFSVLGGADTDVHNLMIMGKIADQVS